MLIKRFIISLFFNPKPTLSLEEQLDEKLNAIRSKYGINPNATAEEAEKSYNESVQKYRAVSALNAYVSNQCKKIKLADSMNDVVKSYALRAELQEKINQAKKIGLL